MDTRKSIKVTDEMIRRGAQEFRSRVGDARVSGADEDIVRFIFAAMLSAYKSGKPGPKARRGRPRD
jgi:hypothetical protein